MLLSSLSISIANVALPTLAQALSASFQEVQWIVLAYLLAITALIVSVGRLGDITGRRRLLLAGIFLFTVASDRTGTLPFRSDGWKSRAVVLLSLSQFNDRQEAIVLMPPHSWIRGKLGLFVADPEANRPWRAFLRLVG